MGKNPVIIAVALPAAIVGVIAFLLVHFREPVYQGKTLTAWLEQYGTNHESGDRQLEQQAQTALRHFGSKAVPLCLKMISVHPSGLKRYLLVHLPPVWITGLRLPSVPVYEQKLATRRSLGEYGLITLAADARSAVPSLVALLDDRDRDVRRAAIFVLAELGPDAQTALPSLIKSLDSPDPLVRLDAAWALGNLHTNAPTVVPILAAFLEKNDKNNSIRVVALEALGQFNDQAASTIPILRTFLDNQDPQTEKAASNALQRIERRNALTEIK